MNVFGNMRAKLGGDGIKLFALGASSLELIIKSIGIGLTICGDEVLEGFLVIRERLGEVCTGNDEAVV